MPDDPAVSGQPGDSVAMQAFTDSLPAQFNGTQVDGAISVASDGRLVPTLALRRLFDYFISGYGDYSSNNQPGAVRKAVARYTQLQGLGDTVRAQVLGLFDDYIRLQQRVADQSASFADTDMATRLRILQEMRIAELGPQAADAFYGQEEQAIQRALIQQDSPTPKEQSSQAYKQARLPSELHNQVTAARQNGATEAQIHAMRMDAVGAQATSRLETLDARRNQWQTKYRSYARERDTISQSAMSQEDKTQAIADLRAREFTADEQRRVSALDRITPDSEPAN